MTGNTLPIDRRVARTKSTLWKALLNLIRVKEWEDINVRLICVEANVARSSFYLHFQNKQALLDYGFSVGREALLSDLNRSENATPFRNIVVWLVDHVSEGRDDFFRSARTVNPDIFTRFKKSVSEVLVDEFQRHGLLLSEIERGFIIGGIFAVIEDWLIAGCRHPKAAVVDELEHALKQISGQM